MTEAPLGFAASDAPAKPGAAVVAGLTALFFALGLAGILRHELWLDEAQHWLLGRDSTSMRDLFSNALFDSHPVLWDAILFLLARVTANPLWMQVLNLAIATIAVALFVRAAPFRLAAKSGIIFSYFIFYEYTVISRNYALAFLCLTMVCVLFRDRRRHYVRFCLALALLASVHVLSAIIAIGFLMIVTVEQLRLGVGRMDKRIYWGAAIVLLAVIFTAYQAHPTSHHVLHLLPAEPYLSTRRIGKAFALMWKAMFPFPEILTGQPWNTNIVNTGRNHVVAGLFYLIGWFVPMVLLARRTAAFAFFLFVALSIALITYVTNAEPYARHHGFLFIALIAALWIDADLPAPPSTTKEPRLARTMRARELLLPMILSVQVVTGLFMFVTDLRRPFSNGRAVSEWIKMNASPGEMILTNSQFAGPSISAYLQRRLCYPEVDGAASFFDLNRRAPVSQEDALRWAFGVVNRSGVRQVLFVTSAEPASSVLEAARKTEGVEATKMATFDGALQSMHFTIYRLHAVKGPWMSLGGLGSAGSPCQSSFERHAGQR